MADTLEANPLALDLARSLDPVTLANKIGLEPEPWQELVLRSRYPRVLLNCHRQAGKSTIAGLLAVHVALYQPGSLILLLSPAQRQSQELFKKAIHAYRALGRPVPPETENRLALELENGSRIVSLPGQEATVRSFSNVKLLVVDEAARVPDELYFSVRPMLAVSRGRLVAMSTPFGRRGWWYEAHRSEAEFERYEVKATECPRISQAFLDEEKATLGDWWFNQEYLCEFMDAATSAFALEDIERMFTQEVESWDLLSSGWM